jgi:hypothetical protein
MFFFLHGGIDTDFVFVRSNAVQRNRGGENFLKAASADAFAEINQIGGVTGKLPLKFRLSAKSLVIRILYPASNHRFIT